MKRPVARRRPSSKRDDTGLHRQLTRAHQSGAIGAGRWRGLPLAHQAGHELGSAWLSAIGGTRAGTSLQKLVAESPVLNGLIAAMAEAAPYLWTLVCADPMRFLRLLRDDPHLHLAAILANGRRAIAAARTGAAVMRHLRRMKAEVALLVALVDIGGLWSVEQITGALTGVANTAVEGAVRYLLREAEQAGKYSPADFSRPETGSGYIVLAMGKMGADELNFSSDIDLMVFFDRSAATLAAGIEPGAFYVRITRELVKLLQERTADGYVFRVDLRLRPDPSSTQIAISTEAALD